MLSVKGLSKSYNNKTLFSDIDISVKPETISFMLGPSGVGKTTLLKILAALEESDTGDVTVDSNGRGALSAQQSSFWPEVTMVFQQLFLWPHLTLRENILLPILKRRGEVDRKNTLEELIEALGMSEFIDRYPNQVSGGQRQRAAIARAVALEPRYLLLDEVTSALDVHQREKLQQLLKRLLQRGTGILAITHSLSFAEYFFPKPEKPITNSSQRLSGCYILNNGELSPRNIHNLVHQLKIDKQPLWQDPHTGL